MIDQNQFIKNIIRAINQANIPYMISGSIGSSFHGQPRATNDADIVIDPSGQQLLAFIESLEPDCYVSKEAALQALADSSMFNIIDIQSGLKADLIICKKRPFSRQEFARRIRAVFSGIEVYVLSPEDSILSKLEWSKNSQSQLQFNDALGILNIQKDKLNFDYLEHWAKELGVKDSLEQLIARKSVDKNTDRSK